MNNPTTTFNNELTKLQRQGEVSDEEYENIRSNRILSETSTSTKLLISRQEKEALEIMTITVSHMNGDITQEEAKRRIEQIKAQIELF